MYFGFSFHPLQISYCTNSLPNEKILGLSKLKEYADDKLTVAEMMISVFDKVENIVEKGENAWLPAFSPFPTMFSNAFLSSLGIDLLLLLAPNLNF